MQQQGLLELQVLALDLMQQVTLGLVLQLNQMLSVPEILPWLVAGMLP